MALERGDVEIPLHNEYPTDVTTPSADYASSATDGDLKKRPHSQHRPPPPNDRTRTVFEWSRHIKITTEPLWIARVKRHKLRTFLLTFFPSVVIFLMAFFLAPPSTHSANNDLKFYLGGLGKPNMQFTAGIVPKRFHSRNDYDQYAPLLAAISYGASSVEIDLWEDNGVLYVGDSAKAVYDGNDLQSVYLSQVEWLLESANKDNTGNERYGIFATAPFLPVQLVFNIVTDGVSGYQLLLSALQPLHNSGYLTNYDRSLSNPSPTSLNYSSITAIASGTTPLSSITSNADQIRYIFFDAPLKDLQNGEYNHTISPMASASWDSTIGARWLVPSLARKKIREYVITAHSKSITTRFYKTPDIPRWARNKVWQMLLDSGSDWLDVTNLCDAGYF